MLFATTLQSLVQAVHCVLPHPTMLIIIMMMTMRGCTTCAYKHDAGMPVSTFTHNATSIDDINTI